MRIRLYLLLWTAACGGAPAATTCTDLTGTYAIHYVPQSGNCGSVPDTTYVAGSPTGMTCTTASDTTSADGCTETFKGMDCVDGAGVRTVTSGTIATSPNGLTATSDVTLSIWNASGTYVCTGAYRILYTKH